jgi:hypothetical protein
MTRTKKNKSKFLFNPNDPQKSFDVYIDKNPNDTISIKYSTIKDVKDTIQKLERLYKEGKYSHKRIWQVAMIMKVRLQAIKKHKERLYPNAKNVTKRYKMAEKYYESLKKRTIQNRKKGKTKKIRKKYRGGVNPDDSGRTDKEDISDDELDINNLSNISFDTFMSTDTPNSFLVALNPPTEDTEDTEDSLMLNNISDTSLISEGPRSENPHAHYLDMDYDPNLSSDDENENKSQSGGKRYKKKHRKTRKKKN